MLMNCDVCNAETTPEQGVRIEPEKFRRLLAKGFGVDETNIKMLTEAGLSREQAVAMLGRQYAISQSDWLLCAECAARAKAVL